MEEIYTEDLLVRYLYKESDLFEKLEVEYALEKDRKLRAIFTKLRSACELFPKVRFTPSDRVLNRILSESRETALQV